MSRTRIGRGSKRVRKDKSCGELCSLTRPYRDRTLKSRTSCQRLICDFELNRYYYYSLVPDSSSLVNDCIFPADVIEGDSLHPDYSENKIDRQTESFTRRRSVFCRGTD